MLRKFTFPALKMYNETTDLENDASSVQIVYVHNNYSKRVSRGYHVQGFWLKPYMIDPCDSLTLLTTQYTNLHC